MFLLILLGGVVLDWGVLDGVVFAVDISNVGLLDWGVLDGGVLDGVVFAVDIFTVDLLDGGVFDGVVFPVGVFDDFDEFVHTELFLDQGERGCCITGHQILGNNQM